ncbi:tRNA-Thr(GGU) m(6)t(6)A37 methyltransferase TsaA [Clostridium cavendishii DSM 21758]|uniref:tRNA-Thr(GGU) m(6)t(6)A37 methyltransferase TsaA n=1 Tax=Clostridium cavendishii DSM 21758 TaxID=1121302 RepID=A0A1M6R5Y3_9CLOT|nr:tRNA (N6-threonylcarbamoyladenosine(37)-N6)-methyltransferase TrmO [Clostridium cavendishii]SHK27810.1 tRNA-Thr(GGU) m(6)t(6)A37 methyltransferase TsaA [Clostridium cavendishii DSM 21758]
MELKEIGKIKTEEENMFIQINKEYIKGLQGLEGFSHIDVLWWFDKCDNSNSRSVLEVKKPYKNSPEKLGVFSTRSPERPNPIALSVTQVTHIDYEKGIIYITYIDAMNDSSILDLKPYTPSLDKVEKPYVPQWCSHWPLCYEKSGDFDWQNEFLF